MRLPRLRACTPRLPASRKRCLSLGSLCYWYGLILNKITHSEFLERLGKLSSCVSVSDEYRGALQWTKATCSTHNYTWDTRMSDLLYGRVCPICLGKRLKVTTETLKAKVMSMHPYVTVLGEYIDNRHRVRCLCRIHNHEWNPLASALLQGQGCPICHGTFKKTQEQFVEELHVVNPNLVVTEKYNGLDRSVGVQCKTCGYTWAPLAGNIIRGQGCPCCKICGYNPHKPAQFYVYKIDNFVGFGITTSPESRHKIHRVNFRKHHVAYDLLPCYYSDGITMKEMESEIKRKFDIIGCTISGFKTESIAVDDLDVLICFVEEYLGIGYEESSKSS